jgi:hypothetical protein
MLSAGYAVPDWFCVPRKFVSTSPLFARLLQPVDECAKLLSMPSWNVFRQRLCELYDLRARNLVAGYIWELHALRCRHISTGRWDFLRQLQKFTPRYLEWGWSNSPCYLSSWNDVEHDKCNVHRNVQVLQWGHLVRRRGYKYDSNL